MTNFDLEGLFGCSVDEVDAVIQDMDSHVSFARIPKKDGKFRTLTMPSDKLKAIQTNVLKNILYRYRASASAHGFMVGRSIVTGAQAHTYQRTVMGCDIKSFFDNIRRGHLENVLFGNRNLCEICRHKTRGCTSNLYRAVAEDDSHSSDVENSGVRPPICEEILAVYDQEFVKTTGYQSLMTRVMDLCIYQNKAPQGFPTSPAIGNLVLRHFDVVILRHCRKHDINYTRYADDLTFSSTDKSPREMADLMLKPVQRNLFAYGFRLNKDKTRILGPRHRHVVTGVVVNSGTGIGRKRRLIIKAMLYNVMSGKVQKTDLELMQLKGLCAFMKMLNPAHGKYLERFSKWLIQRRWQQRRLRRQGLEPVTN